MKNRVIILILTAAVLAVVLFFQLRRDKKIGDLAPGVHQVKVKEVIHTRNYTYVLVSEAKQEYWCALNKADIEVGKTYFWLKGWEMNHFHSEELNRDFASVFLLETLSEKPIVTDEPLLSKEPGVGENSMSAVSMGGKQNVAGDQRGPGRRRDYHRGSLCQPEILCREISKDTRRGGEIFAPHHEQELGAYSGWHQGRK
jgi:Flp pilus assembly protein CpaB